MTVIDPDTQPALGLALRGHETPVAGGSPLLTIDGRREEGATTAEVVDPATGRPFITVPVASVEQLDRAVAAAKAAAPAWAALSLDERQAKVSRLADAVRDHADELAALLTREQGKPLQRAHGEIGSGLAYVDAFCGMEIPTEVVRDGAERIEIRRVPVGVTAAITAWNYPLLLALWKIGPALVAGNPMIVKPSPFTPVATLRLGEIAQEVLPPGILQVLNGGDDLGRAITEHPGVRKVSFTGSYRAGAAIMAASAPTMKRLTLELGGNDAGIVLADADPKAIAADLYAGAMSNCGQVCAGLKRLFVPEERADEYAAALAEVAAEVVVGPGLDPSSAMGPVQNAAQLARVQGLLASAVESGAEVYFSGAAPAGDGYWHPVTLVRGVADDNPIVAEEQFGPIMPMLTYRTVEEAVERANATEFGLGASVWGTDVEAATKVAEQLEAGSVWVNQHPNLSPDTPFGGVKQSGIGVEASLHGLLAYTDISVLRVKR